MPERVLAIVRELAACATLAELTARAGRIARNEVGADGVCIVLRDGDRCHYVDEDAIAPLWKGLRFPMETCISGWVMLNGRAAVIEDITVDPRIPQDAYRPTFVRSLAMVPMRGERSEAAVGAYWAATGKRAGDRELGVLQAIADAIPVCLRHIALVAEADRRRDEALGLAEERRALHHVATREIGLRSAAEERLRSANRELEQFAYLASHDLQEPIRMIAIHLEVIRRRFPAAATGEAAKYFDLVQDAALRMRQLVDDVLSYARLEPGDAPVETDADQVLHDVLADLRAAIDDAGATIESAPLPRVSVRPTHLAQVFQNLIGNAVKFRAGGAPRVVIGCRPDGDAVRFTVGDNGPGIAPEFHERIFAMFARLHRRDEHPGTGIGLAVCKKIVEMHQGRIWVESTPGAGAAFHFTLPAARAARKATG